MKKLNSSLKSSVILISLALLSAEVLANNNEHLSFNYTREDDINLDPRLGIQAEGCLAKSVPLKIHFRFQPGIVVTDLKMRLLVNGDDWSKGYTVFSPSVAQGTITKSTTDKSLLIPWRFSVNGGMYMEEEVKTQHGATKPKYGRKFCFAQGLLNQGYIKYPNTWGFGPIFDPRDGPVPFYAYTAPEGHGPDGLQRLWDRFCGNTALEYHSDYNWGKMPRGEDEYKPTPEIEALVANRGGDAFLTGQHFFESFTAGTPSSESTHWGKIAQTANADYEGKENNYGFRFNNSKGAFTRMDPNKESSFTVTLDNRNISSITLTIQQAEYPDTHEMITWKVDENDYMRNWLRMSHSELRVIPRESDNSDSYKVKNFYKQVNDNFFKGSLASLGDLNDTYQKFIKHTPLTIPPQVSGDINLVNTESLTFTIGRRGSLGGALNMNVYGTPLKFGPMLIGNKKVISATQMSQLCN